MQCYLCRLQDTNQYIMLKDENIVIFEGCVVSVIHLITYSIYLVLLGEFGFVESVN